VGDVSVRPIAIGTTAYAALAGTGGRARVLARLSTSTYLAAGADIVWLGAAGAVLHPRAVLTRLTLDLETDDVHVDLDALTPWRPPPLPPTATLAVDLAGGWTQLAAGAPALGTPAGFGGLIVRAPLAFPLDGARAAAEALAHACARDDAAGATDAALGLLGLGGGLTPSGDDFVGSAFFARAQLAGARLADPRAWRRAADAVLAAAPARTHPISVALLGDLVAGRGWAPLHDLLAALATRVPSVAQAAARRLVALGHTSGWDLLAGLGAGLGTLPAPLLHATPITRESSP